MSWSCHNADMLAHLERFGAHTSPKVFVNSPILYVVTTIQVISGSIDFVLRLEKPNHRLGGAHARLQ